MRQQGQRKPQPPVTADAPALNRRGAGPPDVADADPVEVARLICLRQLETAPRTRAQLATVLARRNVPPESAAVILDRFVEVGLIDDSQYARAWVDARHRGRGLARRALSQELRQRGVPEPEAARALAELDPAVERATARRLVDRKLAGMAGLDPAVRMRRLSAMLARKGYPASTAYEVVREAVAWGGLLDGPESGA